MTAFITPTPGAGSSIMKFVCKSHSLTQSKQTAENGDLKKSLNVPRLLLAIHKLCLFHKGFRALFNIILMCLSLAMLVDVILPGIHNGKVHTAVTAVSKTVTHH